MNRVLKGSPNGFKVVEQSDKHIVYDLQSTTPTKNNNTTKKREYTVKLFQELFDY
jgi:hypothetical protein